MKTLNIKGSSGDSAILVGESIKNLKKYIPIENTIIITDENVAGVYKEHFLGLDYIQISPGEENKTLKTMESIYQKLIELSADRSTFILGIGGGIVCDVAGFAASTYQRGLRFGFVSSTLLSQVDASVGGKNGVNFQGYKNMVGVFNQPEFVICDMDLLKTLPRREVLCGFGEIVKHAAIGSCHMLSFLEENYEKAVNLDPEVIERLVYDSVVIKSDVVNMDEKEKGERRKLNFGHTVGHAIEKCTEDILHGEAISAGMVAAMGLSVKKGLLPDSDAKRVTRLLENLGLPTSVPVNLEKLLGGLGKDKKKEGAILNFVLLNGIGKAVVEAMPMDELLDSVSVLCGQWHNPGL